MASSENFAVESPEVDPDGGRVEAADLRFEVREFSNGLNVSGKIVIGSLDDLMIGNKPIIEAIKEALCKPLDESI